MLWEQINSGILKEVFSCFKELEHRLIMLKATQSFLSQLLTKKEIYNFFEQVFPDRHHKHQANKLYFFSLLSNLMRQINSEELSECSFLKIQYSSKLINFKDIQALVQDKDSLILSDDFSQSEVFFVNKSTKELTRVLYIIIRTCS